jgi:hypothetical protein
MENGLPKNSCILGRFRGSENNIVHIFLFLTTCCCLEEDGWLLHRHTQEFLPPVRDKSANTFFA